MKHMTKGTIPTAWLGTGIAMLRPVLEILHEHIDITKKEVLHITMAVEDVEHKVLGNKTQHLTDLNTVLASLHESNSRLIKLERSYNFQAQLVTAVNECLVAFRTPPSPITTKNEEFVKQNVEAGNRSFKSLEDAAALHSRSHSTAQYSIEILPRRISNQYAAVSSHMKIRVRTGPSGCH